MDDSISPEIQFLERIVPYPMKQKKYLSQHISDRLGDLAQP
jgi:hypothetical protein